MGRASHHGIAANIAKLPELDPTRTSRLNQLPMETICMQWAAIVG
jgi:hypothetical protein